MEKRMRIQIDLGGSASDQQIISHLSRFSTGKGHQERSFEIRRLLLAAISNGSEAPVRPIPKLAGPQTLVPKRPENVADQATIPDVASAPESEVLTSKEFMTGMLDSLGILNAKPDGAD